MKRSRLLSAGALLGAAILAAPLAAGPALALGDPEAAQDIVAGHCSTCHRVPGFAAHDEPTRADAPPFQAIAEQPTRYTTIRLRSFLHQPHYPMSSLSLSDSEIEDLVAFIESLRRKTP